MVSRFKVRDIVYGLTLFRIATPIIKGIVVQKIAKRSIYIQSCELILKKVAVLGSRVKRKMEMQTQQPIISYTEIISAFSPLRLIMLLTTAISEEVSAAPMPSRIPQKYFVSTLKIINSAPITISPKRIS